MRDLRIVVFIVAMVEMACHSNETIGDLTGGKPSSGGFDALVLAGGGFLGVDSGGPPTFDANCGAVTTGANPIPVNLLLVLDRSGSMTNKIENDDPCDQPGTGCNQRWETMRVAMSKVLANTHTSIAWGLKFFSSPEITGVSVGIPEGCGVSALADVPIGSNNGTQITATITATSPNYNTPTRAAIESAVAYLKTVNDGRAKYILLATDGQPNCALNGEYATSPDLTATLLAISAAKAAGISVYVIGVGPSAGNLDEMAARGGTGKFYPALSPESLSTALNTIAGLVASCEFSLGKSPPNPALMGVYLDKNLISRDDSNGWSLGVNNTILFTGSTCTRIRSGAYTKVDVLFGCVENPLVIP